MSLKDETDAEQADVEQSRLLERVARWEARARSAERELKARLDQLEALQAELSVIEAIDGHLPSPPKWLRRRKVGADHIGTPCLLISDLHLDEVVNPAEIGGANAYDRDIAEARLRRTLEGVEKVAHHHLKGVAYDGAALLLGGDLFTGDIHEELTETNADTMIGSLVWWLDRLHAFVAGYVEMFGRVHVWGVVGNHGRTTRKPRAKLRVRTNFDWLLYRMLARDFAGDDRVTFTIPESSDVTLQVHDTTFLFTHGDQFRGGTGISGMMAPLMLGRHRKDRRESALDRSFDWLVMGHWHQLMVGQGLIVNGALKGYDEYAYVSNFVPEPPAQAFWITTPEHGVTFTAPIFPADRKTEGW